mmetsp:Transcript_51602/g.124265  ORF Transcript_51602/g.124265 Transcript_51602/m.124265 type:complete len:234 (-) Transcript_51602:544-1245(-)
MKCGSLHADRHSGSCGGGYSSHWRLRGRDRRRRSSNRSRRFGDLLPLVPRIEFRKTAVHAGHDAPADGCRLEVHSMGHYCLGEETGLLLVGHGQGTLHDIVCVLIVEHLCHCGWPDDFGDQTTTRPTVGAVQTLLDDIGAEFLARKIRDAALDTVSQLCEKVISCPVDAVLHDIVAVLVLHELEYERWINHLVENRLASFAGGGIDAPLHDTAAMALRRHGQQTLGDGLIHER